MPDLLLEFFSEEIPARMQARAAEDLRKLITDRLVEAGLTYEGAKAFATPRRLALAIAGIPARQPDVREERKGPRVGANEKAVAGFLKAAGLASIEQAKIQQDPKGDFYVALIEKAGRPAIEVIARDRAGGGEGVSLAEVDALGRGLGQSRRAQLGAAAAFHRRDVRPGDRGPRHGAVCARRHQSGRHHLRPPLHGAGRDQGAPPRRLSAQARKPPRSWSMPTAASR